MAPPMVRKHFFRWENFGIPDLLADAVAQKRLNPLRCAIAIVKLNLQATVESKSAYFEGSIMEHTEA